jgi:hypothetical protein
VQQANPGEHPVKVQPCGGGGVNVQEPLMHSASEGHSSPQPPQLFWSLPVSIHPCAQQLSPNEQPVEAQVAFGRVHAPSTHESPEGHTLPQAPQLKGSKSVFALHVPPSGPPSPAKHSSVTGSHVVPAGQLVVAHDAWLGGPSSDSRVEREQPARSAQKTTRARAYEKTRDLGMGLGTP